MINFMLFNRIKQSVTGTVNSSCDFENDLCGWSVISNGSYQWTRGRKTSPEIITGPDRDKTAAGKVAIQT